MPGRQGRSDGVARPRFDLFKVPCHASRRKIEAVGEVAALLHFIDRAVAERDDQLESMPPYHSWQTDQHGGWTRVSHRLFVTVILIGHHQDAYAAWLLVMFILLWLQESDGARILPACVDVDVLRLGADGTFGRVRDLDVRLEWAADSR